MAVIAVGMVRDEQDVVEGWVRHTLGEVDRMVVADNLSTDSTRAILDHLVDEGLPLVVVTDSEVAYRQSDKTSDLAAYAADLDDDPWTIIVPADADELWYSPAGRLREVLPGLPWNVFQAPLYNHLRTSLDADYLDPFRAMVWRQTQPGALPKVAFRWQPNASVGQGNHSVALPDPRRGGYGAVLLDPEPMVLLRHFPIRSAQHMITKARNGAAAYAAAPDLPEDWGRHWRAWGQILDQSGEGAIVDAYTAHWWYASPIDAGLTRDAAPYRRWELPPEPEQEMP